jgi:hypothetical protein
LVLQQENAGISCSLGESGSGAKASEGVCVNVIDALGWSHYDREIDCLRLVRLLSSAIGVHGMGSRLSDGIAISGASRQEAKWISWFILSGWSHHYWAL